MSPANKGSITLLETPNDRITVRAEFPDVSPEILFDYWTNPDLLKKWWPPVVELKAELEGSYHFSWPKQNWHLRGKVTEFRRGKELEFTWKWDHELGDQTQVRLRFEPFLGGGTTLTLIHGNYSTSADGRKLRDEHIEGWMHFLARLQEEVRKEND